MAAIDRLVRAVSSLLSLEEVCRTAAHQLGQTLNSDAVVIFVREGNDLRLMASTCGPKIHPTEIEAVQRACESIGGRSVTAKQPVYVANILKDPRCTQQECRNAGLHAYASIPLSLDDQLIGLLVVASATERDFSLSAGYFETAADQIATTIRNVQRLDEARGYASQLQQTITEFKRAEEALLLNARCRERFILKVMYGYRAT
ncbi:MAG: GAF domain-containing protein [Desulfobacterales bacterium]|nr:GAF domain-containing protein [Desulfobacterales bacterium]